MGTEGKRIGRVCVDGTWYGVTEHADGYALDGIEGRLDLPGLLRLRESHPFEADDGTRSEPVLTPPSSGPTSVDIHPAGTPGSGTAVAGGTRRLSATPGEQDLLRIRPHWAAFAPAAAGAVAFAVLVLAIAAWFAANGLAIVAAGPGITGMVLLVFTAVAWWKWWVSRYYVTTHRVGFSKRGPLGDRRDSHVRISQVTGVAVGVTVFGSLFGYGTLRVATPTGMFFLPYTPEAERVARTVSSLTSRMEDGQTQMANRVAGFGAVACGSCGLPQPAEATYCGDCGTPLGNRCRKCGTPVAGAYCGNCGEASAS